MCYLCSHGFDDTGMTMALMQQNRDGKLKVNSTESKHTSAQWSDTQEVKDLEIRTWLTAE